MKESILGRFDFSSKVRMVVMTGLFMLLGISATFSQSYMTNDDALQTLRQELVTIQTQLNVSPLVSTAPEMFANSAPQFYANWYMIETIYEYLDEAGDAADVRNGIDGARERGISQFLASSVYFDNAHATLTDLLTN